MKMIEITQPPGLEVKLDPSTIIVSSGLTSDQVIDLTAVRGVKHVVQRDSVCFDKEMALAHEMLTSPATFFANPLRAILGIQPTEDSLLVVTDALAHKREVLDKLQEFMASKSKSRSVRDEAMAASDEIFTNASKNSGVFYQTGEDGIPAPGKIEFCAHLDDDRLTILCTDTYGMLKVQPVLQRIGEVFKTGVAGAIQSGVSGAGIGSFMIFNSCSSYYLGVDAGKKTVVGCSFQVVPRAKDKTVLPKNIHSLSVGQV